MTRVFGHSFTTLMVLLLVGIACADSVAADVSIANRPFAAALDTLHMEVDGLFDSSRGEQAIGVYLLNEGNLDLTNVRGVASVAASSGIVLTKRDLLFERLPAGVPVLGLLAGDFSNAVPDKHDLTIELTGELFHQTVVRAMFVGTGEPLSTDPPTWRSRVPEGSAVTEIGGIYGRGPPDAYAAPTVFNETVVYAIPYSGQFGALPYADPWWKPVVVGMGLVSAAAGLCVKSDKFFKLGAKVAILGATKDEIDPFRWGQENTFPGPDEFTLREEVRVTVDYRDPPTLGDPWTANVIWQYVRTTDKGTHSAAISQAVSNLHYTDSRSVDVRSTGTGFLVTAQAAAGTARLKADSGYFVVNVESAGRLVHSAVLHDDGLGLDVEAGDGVYTKFIRAGDLPPIGLLDFFVYGFDVNQAKTTDPPLVAAQEIGGILVAPPSITMQGAQPDATFQVNRQGQVGSGLERSLMAPPGALMQGLQPQAIFQANDRQLAMLESASQADANQDDSCDPDGGAGVGGVVVQGRASGMPLAWGILLGLALLVAGIYLSRRFS